MKICRFDDDKIGLVRGEGVHDVSEALDDLPVLRWPVPHGDALIAALPNLRAKLEALADARAPVPVDSVKMRSPVANPSKIIAAPLNYQKHVDEASVDAAIHHGVHQTGHDGFETPIAKYGLFLKANTSLVGPAEGVRLGWPELRNDHEVELGVVIGKTCRDVSGGDARSMIAGYAIALDMTVRGPQDRSFRKSADTYSVLGPWLVTADEIKDPDALDFSIEVDGTVKQRSNTRLLTVGIEELIAVASAAYTLYPGDIIMTGTPDGVASVSAGQTMTCYIEKIGRMTVDVLGREGR